ncbi:hypothetical protein Ndes2437B_g06625 [Nannochloris sp. 'desiccata']|nr:hypothetical protein KSW81_003906 [Chlorella desiccata (nom. nud.)]
MGFTNISIIDAVDGKQGAVPEADLKQINTGVRLRLWKSNNTWTRTKIAIDLSHIRVMHAFLATSAQFSVVLEDDAESDGDIVPSLQEALCQTPNDFDILYLKAHALWLGNKVGKGVYIFWDGSQTTGYVMTRRFAIKMLEEYSQRPVRLWVDLLVTAKIKAGELQAYMCDPPFIEHKDSLGSTYQTKPCSLDIRPIFNVQNDFMSMRRNSSSQKEALGGHGSGNRRPSSFGAEDFAGLFEDADFLVPSQNPTIPFEPGRTVEVSRQQWAYFSSPSERNKKSPHSLERSIFGLPVLSPSSIWVTVWSIIIAIVDLTYTSFFVPISIAFDHIVPGSSWTWLTIIDCVGTGFYLLDMFLEFHTGFIVKYDVHRLLVKRGRDVARQYVFQGSLGGFWVDAVSILAIIPEILGSALPGISGGGYKAFYLFRLLRLFRVARLLRAAWGVSFLSSPISRALFRRINTATFYLINILFFLAVFLNLMACLWWFLAELEGLENSWVAQTTFSLDLLTAGDPARYLTSLYFSISVLTTVGFGDISAFTVPEMALSGVYMLCSLFYFGYIVNVVGALLSEVSARARSAANLRTKLEDTELWMAERRIPPDLQHQIRRFYFELWAPHGGGLLDADYFLELPVVLRGRIVARLAGEAIRGSKMLGKLNPEIQAHLAEGAVPLKLLAGHNLCEEGDLAEKFWVLQEGKVRFFRGVHATGEVHAPAVIGQAAVFAPWISDCRERMHTVRGVTSCSLWLFNSRPLQKVAKHDPSVLRVLCKSYLQYLTGVEQRWKSGAPVPKRVPRIRTQVEKLLMKAEGKEKQTSQPTSLPSLISLNSAPTVSAAGWDQKTPIHNHNRGRPELSRESSAAIMEDEQLPGGEEGGGGGRGRGGPQFLMGRELEELVIHEEEEGGEESTDDSNSDVPSTSSLF